MQTSEQDPNSGDKHYIVDISPKCQKQLGKIEPKDRRRVEAKLAALAIDPRPPGVAKLKDDIHKIRVGTWRVIYTIDDEARQVVTIAVRKRNERTYDGLR